MLAQGFLKIVRQRLQQQLDSRLELAANIAISAFQSFADGLKEDYDALKAGVMLEVSDSQWRARTIGHNEAKIPSKHYLASVTTEIQSIS